jgi:hypothetical protein
MLLVELYAYTVETTIIWSSPPKMKPTQYTYMTDETTSILVYLSAQDQFKGDQVFSSGRGCREQSSVVVCSMFAW